MFAIERGLEFGDAQGGAPASLVVEGAGVRTGAVGIVVVVDGILRQEQVLQVDVEQACGVFGPLHVASHPEQVIGGTAEHDGFPIGFFVVSGERGLFFEYPGVFCPPALGGIDDE